MPSSDPTGPDDSRQVLLKPVHPPIFDHPFRLSLFEVAGHPAGNPAMNGVEIEPVRRLIKRKELVSKLLKKTKLLFGNRKRGRCDAPEVFSGLRSGIGPIKALLDQVTADRPAFFNQPGARSAVWLFKRGLRTIGQRLNSQKG